MIDALSERGSSLLERLETTSDQATTAISSASERLSASLNFKTEHVHDEFADLAARLQQMMTCASRPGRAGFRAKVIRHHRHHGRPLATIHGRDRRHQLASCGIDRRTRRRGQHGAALDRRFAVLDLSLRGGDVVSKLEQTGARITDTMTDRSNAVADTFRESAESMVTTLNNRGDARQGHASGAPAGLRGPCSITAAPSSARRSRETPATSAT